MIRSALTIVLIVLLTGCAQLCPQLKNEPPEIKISSDQLAFEGAFAAFQESNQIIVLEDFIGIYPQSPWAARAHTVVLYARELEQRKEQLKQQESVLVQKEQQLHSLRLDNANLAETIEQLKTSLIETEKRPL